MAHKPATIALLALGVGFAVASCAFQPKPATPLVIQKEIQPALLNRARRTRRKEIISRRQRLGLCADHRRDSSLV